MDKVHKPGVYKCETLSSEFRRTVLLLATPFRSVLAPVPLYSRRKASRLPVGWRKGRPHVSLHSVDKITAFCCAELNPYRTNVENRVSS